MTIRRPPRRAVQTLDTVSSRLRRARARLSSWRAVAREFGISPGTAIRVAAGYEPKRADIRAALGLPEFGRAAKCAKCGDCHVTKRCTRQPTFEENARAYADWLAANSAELARRVTWAEWQTVPKGKR